MKKMWLIAVTVIIELLLCLRSNEAQQSYVRNRQLDCYNHFNVTDGYDCNAASPSCPSYLTFRPIHPYDTPTAIAHLLSSDAASISAANNLSSDFETISAAVPIVVVPVNCSCGRRRYQQIEATYKLVSSAETYLTVANNTYQGLTTCQAIMAANPSHDSRNLSVGLSVRIPLRCACPTSLQAASGVKVLVSYLVTWRDDIPAIARRFAVRTPQAIRDANRLSPNETIFPFTTLLLPLESPPPPDWLTLGGGGTPPLSPPPPPPPQPAAAPPPQQSNRKLVVVGVATGAALLLVGVGIAVVFIFLRRRRSPPPKSPPPKLAPPSIKGGEDPPSNKPYSTDMSSTWSRSSQGIRSAVDSLTVYTVEDLRAATDSFGEANKIRGSVFRGSFRGDAAAVKVMKGDVSSEIGVLKRINHSNIVRLSGFCVHGGNTYLVYEYADSGSLRDCLSSSDGRRLLGWKQRVEIAHEVAEALNYLHNFADPPYIHKNLKSSNVLLDADGRAKISNFKLARTLHHDDDDDHRRGLHLTRHVVGTQGYLAPEYVENGLVTPKLDVFAFGVVLLELLSGREAAAAATKNDGGGGGEREELLSESIRRILGGDDVRQKIRGFIDPKLKEEYPLDLAYSMAQLANLCVSTDINVRPNISQVFVTLSKIRSSTTDWDPSDELDRSLSLSHAR